MAGYSTIEETYQKFTQHEHILARADMYIGSLERSDEEAWVVNDVTGLMERRKLSWVPGLLKIFDEILVNAADNKVNDPKGQTLVDVTVNGSEGFIRVFNNGRGIPVEIHKVVKEWVPQMIFGTTLTSSNYQAMEERVTGGRNGLGAKLTNIYSKKFRVETCHKRKRFEMTWFNNMHDCSEPKVDRDKNQTDFTCITFWPDLSRFNMRAFDADIIDLFKRRVYDIAASTDKSLIVKFNDTELPVRDFVDYVNLFPVLREGNPTERSSGNDRSTKKQLLEQEGFIKLNDRWEICVRVSSCGFQQVSFVNSIATIRGGTHVRLVLDQIVKRLGESMKRGDKSLELAPAMIRRYLWIFINCKVANPSFDSQTKEELKTPTRQFASECVVPPSLIKHLLQSSIVKLVLSEAQSKLTRAVNQMVRTSERNRIRGIEKLEDANNAGTSRSKECTLILTEGDSAKALAVSGLGTVGRDTYGVFPLRGKPLNVRDVAVKTALNNTEIRDVVRIMGLNPGSTYETGIGGLRYGHLMIMADQDHDGSHIKGLIINFIHKFWPALFNTPGFITQFITPIIKAIPKRSDSGGTGRGVKCFFTMPEYLKWCGQVDTSRYTIRYYKGLGTSTSAEGREYFERIADHRIAFTSTPECNGRVEMAFGKGNASARKEWVQGYSIDVHEPIDYSKHELTYSEFVDRELILFSIADCERSIPSMVDGLKPGQRKILFACFKRRLEQAIKVAQLSGYVAEHAAYHHGEASLTGSIVNLAQDFVGSNNVPLLVPEGQFGTRLQGGRDSASARYIFTRLAKLTRSLFVSSDDNVLEYKNDDGLPVEPVWYAPVIPMVLVNGSTGIGTGYSTTIPNFNPLALIAYLRAKLNSGNYEAPPAHLPQLLPWYFGFRGIIEPVSENSFVNRGVFAIDSTKSSVSITELPVGKWTSKYKKDVLEPLLDAGIILSMHEAHTDVTVEFELLLHPEVFQTWQEDDVMEKRLDLCSAMHATNLVCFNEVGKLTEYASAESIVEAFFPVRLNMYKERLTWLLLQIRNQCEKLRNMVRFVSSVVSGELIVSNKPKKQLMGELRAAGYKPIPPGCETSRKHQHGTIVSMETIAEEMDEIEAVEVQQAARDYDYLLGMRIWSLTKEMIEKVKEKLCEAEHYLSILKTKTPKVLWLEDLQELEEALQDYFKKREDEIQRIVRRRKKPRLLQPPRGRIPTLSADGIKLMNKHKTSPTSRVPRGKRIAGTARLNPSAKQAAVKRPRSPEVATLSPPSEGINLDAFGIHALDTTRPLPIIPTQPTLVTFPPRPTNTTFMDEDEAILFADN